MMIQEFFDLTKFNTFGVKVNTRFFVEITNENELLELLDKEEFKKNKKLFLGGGSNILFTKDFEGMIVLNKIKGISIEKEDESNTYIKSLGGENWHELVLYVVEKGYWGIENLSLIPGSVGAAPVQNIGAYGVELKDVLEKVEVLDLETGEKKFFLNLECEFGYRDSIFKNKFKDKYFILSITLRLSKKEKKNTEYKALKEFLEKNNISPDTSKIISDAVVAIRQSKLPDPRVIGNAGSFFKNVFVDEQKLDTLLKDYPNMPYFREEKQGGGDPSALLKIPSGWLIEQCGWKGKKVGNVGVYEKQSLVIVNHGNATGEEIKNLSDEIIKSVFEKFNLILIPEVNIM